MQEAIPAATVVVFRRGADGSPPEILMVTRDRAMSFAGGMAVFPGGRVDPADYELAGALGWQDADEAAHRVAAVRRADMIAVLDEGKLVEQGTHDELLARGGVYADIYRTQAEETP